MLINVVYSFIVLAAAFLVIGIILSVFCLLPETVQGFIALLFVLYIIIGIVYVFMHHTVVDCPTDFEWLHPYH